METYLLIAIVALLVMACGILSNILNAINSMRADLEKSRFPEPLPPGGTAKEWEKVVSDLQKQAHD